jgi:hypothetical protein
MNNELETSLVWQMNQEQPIESERAKADPSRHLDRVYWRPSRVRPLIYAENRNYMQCELLAHWVWRNLKLDLQEVIEIGSIHGFSYVRARGRTFAEYRYNITELDRKPKKG